MNIDFSDNNFEGISEKNISRVISLCTAFDLYIKLIMITKLCLFLLRWREKVYELLVQQKSASIVQRKDEQNWLEKVSEKLKNRLTRERERENE